MICSKCGGRVFLDRTFSDNKNFEASCLICGSRKFISKGSELGRWLEKKEKQRTLAESLGYHYTSS